MRETLTSLKFHMKLTWLWTLKDGQHREVLFSAQKQLRARPFQPLAARAQSCFVQLSVIFKRVVFSVFTGHYAFNDTICQNPINI